MNNHKPYTKYKPSGIAWLGDIPEHWDTMRLKYIFQIQKRIADELGYDVLSITHNGIKIKDISSGAGQLAMDYSKYQRIYSGEFGMNHMDLLTGYVDISKFDGVTSPDYRVFSLIEHNSDKEYLLRLLQLCYKQKIFYAEGQGAAQFGRWRMPSDNFKNFQFPIPSKKEQTAIANFIDYKLAKIDRFIRKKKQLIKLLNEQKASIINQAVTKGLDPNAKMKPSGIEWLGDIPEHWEIVKLSGVCDFVRGNSSFKKDELLSNGKFVALQYGKTYKVDEVNEEYQFYINDEFYKDSQTVDFGDVIIISTSETIEDLGHSVFYNRLDLGLLGGEQILLRPKNDVVNGKYLCYSSKIFANELKKHATGVKVYRFNINDLKTIYTPIPSIEEQLQIVGYIEKETAKLNQTITTIEKEIALVEEYKTALIAEAVTGKIDVRDFEIPNTLEEESEEVFEVEQNGKAEDIDEMGIE
ncbi:MAG: restriction endonuclease subunit S [Bacteroidales bacterium]